MCIYCILHIQHNNTQECDLRIAYCSHAHTFGNVEILKKKHTHTTSTKNGFHFSSSHFFGELRFTLVSLLRCAVKAAIIASSIFMCICKLTFVSGGLMLNMSVYYIYYVWFVSMKLSYHKQKYKEQAERRKKKSTNNVTNEIELNARQHWNICVVSGSEYWIRYKET